MASNEWLVRKLHEQDKKIEALSRGGTGVGHSSIAPGENLTVISDNGEVVLGAGGVEHVDGPTPATPSAPTLKLGFGTIETTWDGTFAEGEDEDGVPLTAPVDFDVVEVHCSTDPEEEEWGEDTMRGQIKTREGGTITVGGFDVDDEVFVCLIALAKTGKRSAPSATASLVIEGLDFSQLFTEIDAANATIKNAGEVLVTEQGTLDEKLTEVDGTLNDLGQDLAAVEDAQAQLNTDLTDVMTSVDGKNTITWNPSAPSAVSNPGKAVGDLWYRTSGNSIIGFWKWDGTDWVTQLLDKTTIPLIDIGAGTFGSLAGSRLIAESVTADKLLVGGASNMIANPSFESGSAGWVMSNITPDSTVSHSGTQSAKMMGSSGAQFMYQSQKFNVVAGDTYRVSVWAMVDNATGTSSNGGGFRIHSANSDGTPGAEYSNGWVSDRNWSHRGWDTPGEWFWLETQWVAPVTDAVIIRIAFTAAHTRGTRWVDDFAVVPMTDSTLITPGAVTTPKLSADVLEVKNLKATSGQLDEAVINKLFSDVVVAKMAVAEQFIGENAILTGAVTAPKITASEELWAKIAQFVKIRAEHIAADAIDGMVITGATIRSAATGARTLMSASGFEAYNTANERTFFASASTGEVSMIGKLFTGKPGFSRVAIDPTLWSSLPVYDGAGGIAGYASGAGVRVGVDASSSADFYHAALSNGTTSGVFRSSSGKSVVSVEDMPLSGGRSLSSVEIFGEVSEGKTYARFGDGMYATYNDKADSSYSSIFTVRKNSSQLKTNSGNYSSKVEAGSSFARLSSSKNDNEFYSTVDASSSSIDMFTSYNPRGSTAAVQLVNGTSTTNGYVNIAAENINPIRVNYLGTGDSWIIPFRKSGTDWGYVGSSGAMGVDDFGIQSAAGKNLVLRGEKDILHYANRHWANYNSTTGTTNIRMTTNGFLGVVSSSQRYKDAIEPATETVTGLVEKILSVDARTWFDKNSAERLAKSLTEEIAGQESTDDLKDVEPLRRIPGVIAEEMHDAGLGILVEYNDDGLPESVMYDRLGAMLLPVVRDLHDRITELERLTNE